ncbi:MAG: carboxypeptidase-like regulatory domain-containing protein [Phycisphaerales bacterium]
MLEVLEPRVLLSAVGLGDLPKLNKAVEIDGSTYRIMLPGDTYQNSLPTASGNVFLDMDGDGMWDPNEHALTGVKVFLDADRDGVHDENERSTLTGSAGNFVVPILSSGTFSFRAEMPKGYKATRPGSDVASVQLTGGKGVGGLTFGLARTGFDVGVAFSEVSMPDRFQTGATATIPVLVTNHGDQALRGAGVKVRIFMSSDQKRSGNDLRLTTVALGRGLEPGESVKLMLEVELADALADFQSYLLVDVVGKGVRGDVSRADNIAATGGPILFVGSTRKPDLSQDEIDTIVTNWDVTSPYGGYKPGGGYTGTTTIGTTLGNWNAGTAIGAAAS